MNFLTSQFDLGNMDQVVWNTVHGNFFQMTSPTNAVHELRSAIHADFLLLAFAPFYALWQDPRILMILQVLVDASGAWPLYWYARRRISQRAAAGAALAYLVYPSLLWSIMFDVHAVVVATPLLLWAFWAAHERRWWIYGLTVLLALASKEEVGVTVALLGLYVAWQLRPRWIGWLTFVVGLGTSVAMLALVIPASRHASGHFALSFYSEYGSSLGQITKDVLLHPWIVWPKFTSLTSLGYMSLLLWPFAFVSLLGWPVLLIALPELGVNLLSSYSNQQTIYYQYTAVITPFVLLGAVEGWRRLSRWCSRRPRILAVARWIIFAAFVSNIYLWSPLPGLHYSADALNGFRPSPYRQSVASLKRLIPAEDKLAVTNNIAPHFSQRPYEWAYDNHLELADGIVILATRPFDDATILQLKDDVARLQTDKQWRLAFHDRDLYYFQRVSGQ